MFKKKREKKKDSRGGKFKPHRNRLEKKKNYKQDDKRLDAGVIVAKYIVYCDSEVKHFIDRGDVAIDLAEKLISGYKSVVVAEIVYGKSLIKIWEMNLSNEKNTIWCHEQFRQFQKIK